MPQVRDLDELNEKLAKMCRKDLQGHLGDNKEQGYGDCGVLCHKDIVLAEHVRSWGKDRIFFGPTSIVSPFLRPPPFQYLVKVGINASKGQPSCPTQMV